MKPIAKGSLLLGCVDEDTMGAGGSGPHQYASFLEKEILILHDGPWQILKHKGQFLIKIN
jgi:hypothetical protein